MTHSMASLALGLIALWLLACSAALSHAIPNTLSEIAAYTYEDYLEEFNKSRGAIGSAEYENRRSLFERNKNDVLQHNSQPGITFTKGINVFTDLFPEELGAFRNEPATSSPALREPTVEFDEKHRQLQAQPMDDENFPAAFSWLDRSPPVLNPAREQGDCGSCWAHAAAACVESHTAIQYGVLLNLSVEQLLACRPAKKGICSGGSAISGFGLLSYSPGLLTEDDYPYVSTDDDFRECRFNEILPKAKILAQVEAYVKVEENNRNVVMRALITHGPLACSVDATVWDPYSSGILHSLTTEISRNHAVVLVGYGEEEVNGRKAHYWTVRNSWGTNWGENGNIRLHRAPPWEPEVIQYIILSAYNAYHQIRTINLTAYGSFGILSYVGYPIILKPTTAPEPIYPYPITPTRITPEPDIPEPDTPVPDTPEPVIPEPDIPEPDTPVPDTPEPMYPEPATPLPHGTVYPSHMFRGGRASKSYLWVAIVLIGGLAFIVMSVSVYFLCTKAQVALNSSDEV